MHGPRRRVEQQQRIHPAAVEAGREPAQPVRAVRPPDEVRVEDEKGFAAEKRQRMGDAAARFQPFPLAGDQDVRLRPPGEMGLDLLCAVVGVDHDARNPGLGEHVERAVDQRPAADAPERLRRAAAEARAEPRGQHHGGMRPRPCHSAAGMRRSAATWRRSHAASGSSAGWARLRSSIRLSRGRWRM